MKAFTDENFDRTVLGSAVPVFVMFSAPWAGPCNLARAAVEQLHSRFGNQMDFGEFVIDDNPNVPERFGVRALPAFLVLDGGRVHSTLVGAVTAEVLEARMLAGLV